MRQISEIKEEDSDVERPEKCSSSRAGAESRYDDKKNRDGLTSQMPKSYLLSNDRRKKYAVISEGFIKTSYDLQRRSFDSHFSGTTVVSIILSGKTLVCANVGDSRAVMASIRSRNEVKALENPPTENQDLQIEKIAGVASEKDDTVWVSTALSRDHKPCMEDEKERILAYGGRVDTFRGRELISNLIRAKWRSNWSIESLVERLIDPRSSNEQINR